MSYVGVFHALIHEVDLDLLQLRVSRQILQEMRTKIVGNKLHQGVFVFFHVKPPPLNRIFAALMFLSMDPSCRGASNLRMIASVVKRQHITQVPLTLVHPLSALIHNDAVL